jgi:hypothetical protein
MQDNLFKNRLKNRPYADNLFKNRRIVYFKIVQKSAFRFIVKKRISDFWKFFGKTCHKIGFKKLQIGHI